MELTLELVKRIVKEYERVSDLDVKRAIEFYEDEDNTGFAFDHMSFDDLCKQVLINIKNNK